LYSVGLLPCGNGTDHFCVFAILTKTDQGCEVNVSEMMSQTEDYWYDYIQWKTEASTLRIQHYDMRRVAHTWEKFYVKWKNLINILAWIKVHGWAPGICKA